MRAATVTLAPSMGRYSALVARLDRRCPTHRQRGQRPMVALMSTAPSTTRSMAPTTIEHRVASIGLPTAYHSPSSHNSRAIRSITERSCR